MANDFIAIIPFTNEKNDARDPSTLVGLQIKSGSSVGGYLCIYTIQTVEEGPINIELRVDGDFESLRADIELWRAIAAATDKKPVQIVEAVLGRRSINRRWPDWRGNEEMRGKVRREEFDVIGLRLAGMSAIGWIWGEYDEQDFYKAHYASAYISLSKIPIGE